MAKGSEFEREFCKALGLWWTQGQRDDIFWRTAGSGARATARTKTNRSTYGQYGDVQAVDPIGAPLMIRVTIELKRGYNQTSPYHLLDADPKAKLQQFGSFLQQARGSAADARTKWWWLVTKRDRRQSMIHLPTALTRILVGTFGRVDFPMGRIWGVEEEAIDSLALADFLEWAHPDFFREDTP